MASTMPETTRVCLRQLGRSTKQQQTRSFSSSANRRRNGPLSVFPPTSSPELDSVLASMRSNVFLPAHLKEAQRRLVYRKYWQRFLTGEEAVQIEVPVTSQASEQTPSTTTSKTETFVLQPLDRQRDEPAQAATFNRVLDLLSAGEDMQHAWQLVLPHFLRELHLAGRVVRPQQAEKLVRRAAAAGKLGLVLECLRRVDTLGVRVATAGVARQLLLAAHQRAAAAGFGLGTEQQLSPLESERELDRAIKNVGTTLLMIQDRRHVKVGQKDDPKECPELYGAAMALVAVRRLLYTTENTPEKVAARQQATANDVSEGAKEEAALESSEAAEVVEEVAEAASGEDTTVETAAAAAAEAEASPQEAFALGKDDLARIEEYGMRMLELSERAQLEFDTGVRREVASLLERWLPVWFGVQVAERALLSSPSSSTLRSRLRAAFDAEINPQVTKALEALQQLESEGRQSGNRVQMLYDAYKNFLSRI